MEMNLPPLPVPFDESEWGRLQGWEELAPGVFEICAERNEGYLIDKEESKGIISEMAYQYGVESADKKFIYFDYDHGKLVIEYEIALYQLHMCHDIDRTALQDELITSALYGAEKYSSYFGPWVPQPYTPWGPRQRYITVDNGIWFVQSNGKWGLSLCHVLSEGLDFFPSSLAQGNRGTYPNLTYEDMYWLLEDCAPVIYELINDDVSQSISKFITSMDDLLFCLCECFPTYAKIRNTSIKKSIKAVQQRDSNTDISYLESQLIKRVEGASIKFLRLPV